MLSSTNPKPLAYIETKRAEEHDDDDNGDDDNEVGSVQADANHHPAETNGIVPPPPPPLGALNPTACPRLQATTTTTTTSGKHKELRSLSNCDSNCGERENTTTIDAADATAANNQSAGARPVELRFLVRRREAGALIGKRGSNIKQLRELFDGARFSIPDTGNGPERVVSIVANSLETSEAILANLTRLFLEKSPQNDEQIELKLLIHSSHAGSIIGLGGQAIKRLRNNSKAAIKIYEMCCPFSSERVCAIKARPPVVVNAIRMIQEILEENPIKGALKPYDALNFDLSLVDKYGGYLPDDCSPLEMIQYLSSSSSSSSTTTPPPLPLPLSLSSSQQAPHCPAISLAANQSTSIYPPSHLAGLNQQGSHYSGNCVWRNQRYLNEVAKFWSSNCRPHMEPARPTDFGPTPVAAGPSMRPNHATKRFQPYSLPQTNRFAFNPLLGAYPAASRTGALNGHVKRPFATDGLYDYKRFMLAANGGHQHLCQGRWPAPLMGLHGAQLMAAAATSAAPTEARYHQDHHHHHHHQQYPSNIKSQCSCMCLPTQDTNTNTGQPSCTTENLISKQQLVSTTTAATLSSSSSQAQKQANWPPQELPPK